MIKIFKSQQLIGAGYAGTLIESPPSIPAEIEAAKMMNAEWIEKYGILGPHRPPPEHDYIIGFCDWCGKSETILPETTIPLQEFIDKLGWVTMYLDKKRFHFCCRKCRNAFYNDGTSGDPR